MPIMDKIMFSGWNISTLKIVCRIVAFILPKSLEDSNGDSCPFLYKIPKDLDANDYEHSTNLIGFFPPNFWE